LALALGMTVKECQEKMDMPEFLSWVAYYQVSPFGDSRADFRCAQISATIANVNRKKGSKAFKASDFMCWENKTNQTPQEMAAVLKIFAGLHNKRYGKG